jgi:tight adherence protein C
MDWLINLRGSLGDLGSDPEMLRLLVASVFGVAAFVLAFAAYYLFGTLFDPLRKRIHVVKEVEESKARKRPSGSFLGGIGKSLVPKSIAKRVRIETLLQYAGLRSEGDLNLFHGFKLLATLVAPALVVALAWVSGRLTSLEDAVLFALAAAALGFLLPDLVLRRLARRRQERLRRGLPDALDLLVVCSEAGLGLNAGIQRVAQEIAITHPDLADELQLVTMQTRAGIDNRAALKGLEERTGLDDIQALVTTLIQSMRFGTSIGETLRIYSAELRDKRLQIAQEKAAKVSTLMLFPLVTCILPSFMVVALGPAILGLTKALSGLGFGK